ncbi:MAG: hypothetical protein ACRDXB_10660 [Actinomycetes bacterium]
MTFWITELPEGGVAMGEANDEQEARLMIESQQRGTVTWHERTARYRWTVVLEGGKTSHGWADSEREAWDQVKAAVVGPPRATSPRSPRCPRLLPPL